MRLWRKSPQLLLALILAAIGIAAGLLLRQDRVQVALNVGEAQSTILFQDDFESCEIKHVSQGGKYDDPAGNVIERNFAHSGQCSARTGAGSTNFGKLMVRLTDAAGNFKSYDDVWLRGWVYFHKNYPVPCCGEFLISPHLWRFHGPNFEYERDFSTNQGQDTVRDFYFWKVSGGASSFTRHYSGFNFASADRKGRWQCWEIRTKLNTPGAADGISEFYADGTLIGRHEGLNIRGGSALGIGRVDVQSNIAKPTEASLPPDMWWLVDDVVISTSRVGCGSTPPPSSSDTTAPSVSISSPSAGASVSGTITVSANASDPSTSSGQVSGVAGVQFLLNGSPLGSEDTTSPYSVSWNTTTVANGTYTLSARARDAAGNQATSGGVSVTVNNQTQTSSTGLTNECASPKAGWIWCDDFETNRLASYFEYDNNSGDFVRTTGVGVDGSTAMRAKFQAGEVNAGNFKLAFGRTPSIYFKPVDAGTQNYRDIYWRMFVKNQSGWTGGGADKLSRAHVLASANWAQAAVGHVWSGSSPNQDYLYIDPASGTDTSGNLKTTVYNDNSNYRWLGGVRGQAPLFNSSNVGKWHCVEARMKLNDAGQSNGMFELWVNGNLDAQKTGMNWLGSYADFGINAIFFENFWNNGSPTLQERYFDNIVVSTQPIGCGTSAPPPPPPACTNPSPLPSGFAAPCPVLSLSASTVSKTGSLTVTATPPSSLASYQYKTIYLSDPNWACSGKAGGFWCPLTLGGTSDSQAPAYVTKNTAGTLNLTSSILSNLSSGTHYVLSWDWAWDQNSNCYKGPGLNTCNTGQWRIQQLNVQ